MTHADIVMFNLSYSARCSNLDIIGFYINGEDYTKKITNQALIDSGTSLMVVNSG